MILVGYVAVVLALGWLRRSESAGERALRIARAGGLVVGLPAVAIALLLLSHHSATTLGDAVLVGLALSGTVYVSGTVCWAGATAVRLRRVGWIAMVLALCVPTTLTLALPLVALLAPTLQTARLNSTRRPAGA